jgi:hypothetical protein
MAILVQGTASLEAIAKQFTANEAQVQRALTRAISRTVRWASSEGRSGIAKELGIRISALKGRVSIYIRKGQGVGKSWFGLNDIPSSRLRPRQTATGATMDGMGEVAHAFVRTAKNGKKFMWLRRTNARYPIDQVGLPIKDAGDEVIAAQVFPLVEEHLQRDFEHELKWETRKK